MYRRIGDASSTYVALAAACSLLAVCTAGPLGPLPNMTSSELGLKEGSCAVGDVVYMPGDEFPGSTPCEKCSCAGGDVQCTKQRCEPRPGCKALHRPDQCCPIYQCECEQKGRVYGNGEKLVDPVDPCLVCYCQGGEVVCRRIACFVRDDCRPRLVPGRCCPEYDNCPLRGVTSVPGVIPSISSISTVGDVEVQNTSKENIKQEITIKEITPVSEIPVITDVKVKEILPSPSIEVAEYTSSKSPLIPREATSEKSTTSQSEITERPVIIEIHKQPVSVFSSSSETTAISDNLPENKNADATPSKISLSTQDYINSDIYPSNVPIVEVVDSSIASSEIPISPVTKAPVIIEEEDTPFDHNPAFPPLPDDLSVLHSHDDEIIPEPNVENEHISSGQEAVIVASITTSSEVPAIKEIPATTYKNVELFTSTEKVPEPSPEISTITTEASKNTETSSAKNNLMLNLRSAIPTEILNLPSLVPEDITGELDEIESTTTTESRPVMTTTENRKEEIMSTKNFDFSSENESLTSMSATVSNDLEITSVKSVETTEVESNSTNSQEQTTSSIAKSNVATEVTSQTELSSLPVETSDQNPHEAPDSIAKEKNYDSTTGSPIEDPLTTKTLVADPKIKTVSKPRHSNTEMFSTENIETTEFVITSFGSSESATDAVELIKISPGSDKSAAIIESKPNTERKTNNAFIDLINLVDDVAAISNHTDGPETGRHATDTTSISESEELIPVNAGYKSKNNNWNLNSITEIPPKSKNQAAVNKQKIIEIEDEESESITDPAPPNDKVEPTTRRPIIDNVSDDMARNKTDKHDIEIIPQTYVPNNERRPTKVVMKKNEKTSAELTSVDVDPVAVSVETATDGKNLSFETTTSPVAEISAEGDQRIEDISDSTSSTAAQ